MKILLTGASGFLGRHVLAELQRQGLETAAAGSCAEYDWAHGYCREDVTPLAPATLYGTAKDATRRLLAALCAAQGAPCHSPSVPPVSF